MQNVPYVPYTEEYISLGLPGVAERRNAIVLEPEGSPECCGLADQPSGKGLQSSPVPTKNLIRTLGLDRSMDRATIRRRCLIS